MYAPSIYYFHRVINSKKIHPRGDNVVHITLSPVNSLVKPQASILLSRCCALTTVIYSSETAQVKALCKTTTKSSTNVLSRPWAKRVLQITGKDARIRDRDENMRLGHVP
ncbi:hypothetical protein N7447_005366 [Penicillium robsamsonii]|uniref:uncharacterized protein n=1 Tax=Penicillium robsamsonii TaxID=1792511 RepID=UPI0025474786|nr:uncharacterized protein N7447_005366 [Penicillium robsamsonii]KAJ5823026.1 hypothetical protein N7447_005366 [Penicillium robsamsonii]